MVALVSECCLARKLAYLRFVRGFTFYNVFTSCSVPVALLACASLGIHAYANTLGIQVASNITKTSVDIVQLFNTVAETMRFSKIGSAIEFTVVALVSKSGRPAHSSREMHLIEAWRKTYAGPGLQTYALMVIELTKYLRQDLRNGKRYVHHGFR